MVLDILKQLPVARDDVRLQADNHRHKSHHRQRTGQNQRLNMPRPGAHAEIHQKTDTQRQADQQEDTAY